MSRIFESKIGFRSCWSERNLDLRDELFALRDATAQSYAHAEALKAQWAEIEKAQTSYYQVCCLSRPCIASCLTRDVEATAILPSSPASTLYHCSRRPVRKDRQLVHRRSRYDKWPCNASVSGRLARSGLTRSRRNVDPAERPGMLPCRRTGLSLTSSQGQASGRSIDEFIQEFKAARKTYHKRAIWAERWSRGEVAWRDD